MVEPVKLDPWQTIVNVHWRTSDARPRADYIAFGVNVGVLFDTSIDGFDRTHSDETVPFGSCGGGVEIDVSTMRSDYFIRQFYYVQGGGGVQGYKDGTWYVGGDFAQPVTITGFPQNLETDLEPATVGYKMDKIFRYPFGWLRRGGILVTDGDTSYGISVPDGGGTFKSGNDLKAAMWANLFSGTICAGDPGAMYGSIDSTPVQVAKLPVLDGVSVLVAGHSCPIVAVAPTPELRESQVWADGGFGTTEVDAGNFAWVLVDARGT
jgi:hypothetical protein